LVLKNWQPRLNNPNSGYTNTHYNLFALFGSVIGGKDMDSSTIISLVALIVSILSLPTSYFLATRQIKMELDEYERRNKQKALLRIANGLDELFAVFNSAVEQILGIEKREIPKHLTEINQHIEEIDAFVTNTGVLARIALAIDGLTDTGYADLQKSVDLVRRLQSIRAQIALGSNPSRYATLGVIAICDEELLSALRKI
jgi:hypothetical protein